MISCAGIFRRPGSAPTAWSSACRSGSSRRPDRRSPRARLWSPRPCRATPRRGPAEWSDSRARPPRPPPRSSQTLGWSGDSPSGRLLTMATKPAALIAATSSGLICGDTLTWSLIRFRSKLTNSSYARASRPDYRRAVKPDATAALCPREDPRRLTAQPCPPIAARPRRAPRRTRRRRSRSSPPAR